MQDYEYIISTILHGKLKEHIKGHIYVTIHDDKLYVEITKDNLKFKYVEYGVGDKILYGMDSYDFMCNIVKSYREFLHKYYFKY